MRSEHHIKTPDTVKSVETETTGAKVPVADSPIKKEVSFARADTHLKDHMPLIVIGEAKIHKVHLMASLSGLRLEGEINGLGSSISYKERVKTVQRGVNVEAVISGNMREGSIALQEGAPPSQQTVVRLTVGPTETNYSSHMWKTKDKNSGSLSIGPVHLNIPQHPVTLHGIMTRSTKQITSTLMEFKGTRILYRGKTSGLDDSDLTQHSSPKMGGMDRAGGEEKGRHVLDSQEGGEESHLIKPLVMTFQLVVESFAVSAALLPSLLAEYKMTQVSVLFLV